MSNDLRKQLARSVEIASQGGDVAEAFRRERKDAAEHYVPTAREVADVLRWITCTSATDVAIALLKMRHELAELRGGK